MEEFKYFNNDTPIFTMNGMKTFARVVNVIDGDTLSLVIPLFDKYFKFSVRIYGIDTCEIHSNDVEIKDNNDNYNAKIQMINMLVKLDKLYTNYFKIIEKTGIDNSNFIFLIGDELKAYEKIFLNEKIRSKLISICKHEWITDLIDIDPDRSQTIEYCKICQTNRY